MENHPEIPSSCLLGPIGRMLGLAEYIVIGSEIVLSLYPILIKLVSTNIPTQVFSRLITFFLGAGAVASPADWASTWGSAGAIGRSLGLGAISLAHIFVSYIAFSSLSAGVAMSLFYTYPIWNLLGAGLLFGETITGKSYAYVLLGIVGTFLVSTKGIGDDIKGLTQNRYGALVGVACALAAALTESAMYFAVKTNEQQNPWSSTLELYGGALACMIPLVVFGALTIKYSWSVWSKIVLFNLIVGFVGYSLRFYSIPKVNTETFGLLSFVGVISSFLFGFAFLGEKPGLMSLLGAGLIALAASHSEEASKAASQSQDQPSASP
jgi:drug/metabolite transporter (DMT)-like permease